MSESKSFSDFFQNNIWEISIISILIPAIGYFIRKRVIEKHDNVEDALNPVELTNATTLDNTNNTTVNVYNSGQSEKDISVENEKKIEAIRASVSILFIDDDVKFKVISILRQAGWLQTKIVKDLKNWNDSGLTTAHIVFVDIQGVGKLLQYPDEGLGLAVSIKEKYPDKKLIIYSADSEGNRFHKAFRLADDLLSKNAVPYEFEVVIENMTNQLIADGIL